MRGLDIRKLLCLAALFTFATKIPVNGQVFKTIASFSEMNGPNPSLVQGTDGSFYGTQRDAVFRVTRDGDITVLHEFGNRSYYALAGLVLATGGRFYGTTTAGIDGSTIFRVTSDGRFTTLFSFCAQGYPLCPDGDEPAAALLQADNGEFYGTTGQGGDTTCNAPWGCGTIFSITSGGQLTTLHTFDFSDGAYPSAALIQDYDGNFYGTTGGGGTQLGACTAGCGTLFTMTSLGGFSILHDFCSEPDCADGSLPQGVIEAADGSLYGVTVFGGVPKDGHAGCGTIYKITQQGIFRTLHAFDLVDGCLPGTLIQATDGNFYGVSGGGSSGWGSIFSITPGGTLTTLHSFCFGEPGPCQVDGAIPTGIIQGTDGKFYGSTFQGGAKGSGTVFSLDLGLQPFITFVRAAGKVAQTCEILGQGFTGTTAVSLNGTPAQFTVVSDTFIRARVPEGATTGYVTVTTPAGVLKSNVRFHVIP
jgi:uncharacterized repeat protein (TIGR03803 family)